MDKKIKEKAKETKAIETKAIETETPEVNLVVNEEKKAEEVKLKDNKQMIKINGEVITFGVVTAKGEDVLGTFEFDPVEGVKVNCTKIKDSNKVICAVEVNGKEMANGLSAQGMFKAVEALTGIATTKVDAMYKKANLYRKEGQTGKKTKTIDISKLEDVVFK